MMVCATILYYYCDYSVVGVAALYEYPFTFRAQI